MPLIIKNEVGNSKFSKMYIDLYTKNQNILEDQYN